MDIQCVRLVDYFKQRKGITRLEAMNILGIGNLPARIFDLRESGYVIDDVWEKNENTGSRYKRYFLKSDPKVPTWTSVDLESIPVDKKTSFKDFMMGAFNRWKNEKDY